MAQNATIYKADIQISDMDRHYYANHHLTLARHPSETDERLMVRVLAFILNAHDDLTMAKGLSADDEPDLWQKDLTGAVATWIEIGQPDEKRLRRACGVSQRVLVYCYSGQSAELWWEQNRRALEKLDKVAVFKLAAETSQALIPFAQRSMQLQATLQDGEVWISNQEHSLQFSLQTLKAAG